MKPREEMIRDLVRQWFAKADLDMGLAEHIVGEASFAVKCRERGEHRWPLN